jgi:CRP-like cAMP-binding protein
MKIEEEIQFLKEFNLPQAELDFFNHKLFLKNFQKGQNLLTIGEKADNFYYLKKGLVRLYYIDSKGNEFIKSFQCEGEIVAAYAEAIQGIPSEVTVEAIEDVEAIVIPCKYLFEAYERNLIWVKVGMKIIEKYYIHKEQRVVELLRDSATERYQYFLKNYKAIAERIPKYLLASYLGIKPESLSRLIRNQK